MIKLSKKDHDLNFLVSEFEGIRFELFSVEKLNFINCIACWFDTSQELVTKWKEIQSIISLKFKPESRFSRWNIYLVLLCPDSLDIRDKYVIENDRYAARKIVFDNLGTQLPLENIESKINIELLGTDLKLQEVIPSDNSSVKLPIASLIKDTPIGSTSESKMKRNEIINKLIEYYKHNEDKES
ncbi:MULTISPECIES: ABC-three component system middle component 1 [Citrobacter freundii complex]|uniref:ABC-three component system middle component 1 n=1 Tax=Citrobacter freundii complex TaxID=1344959 RepID=UPI0007618B70|nr:ABC-three component system middle component 1 [Citrobacter portucalensis]MBD9983717.1 hypothetical protein [Citrobacter portucalensis]MBE0035277.1 hypothetical protein [Citrobacter portucalensis]MBE0038895.1 hypothetical protein [Citrobacter portucalensis]MBE0043887.1 hypothetical protein [Citrobacter portucalensis]MBE0076247.1 hypothetical protein [Citrobacter portucalensis]